MEETTKGIHYATSALLLRYNIGKNVKRIARNSATLKKTLGNLADRRLAEGKYDEGIDMLSKYLPYYKAGEINKEEMIDDLMALMYAGHDTTSHMMTSFIHQMTHNPDIKAKLMNEIKENLF